MSGVLRPTDLHRLSAASEALLSPLAGPSPELWQRHVAASMRELFGVTHAMFVIPESGCARFICDTADATTLRGLVDLTTADRRSGRLRARDPLVDSWFERRSAQRVEVYNERLNDQMLDRQLERSVMVMDVLRPGGFHNFIGFMTARPGHELMLFMGYERGRRSRFGENELAVLGALLPALRSGHHALMTFGVRRSALAATLDAMSEATMLVGSNGRELHRNPALRRALSGEPEQERVAGEMLAAARSLALPAQRIVRDRHDRIGTAAERVVTTPLRRYMVRATHLPSELLGDDRGVLVSLEFPKVDSLDNPSDISRRHGLTRREAEVAVALAQRFSNAEIAQALGISPNTALRHTERVLAKLGVHTRLDVAARLRGGDVGEGHSSGAA